MKIFLWAECQKLRRLSLLLLTIFAVCGIAFMVFIGGKSTDYGPPYLEEAGWYMTMTQPWATLLVLPAVIALLGSYMICREAEDDTLKSLLLVPVSETRLTAAKMLLTFVFSILLYLLLFAITFLGEAILHIHALSTNMVLHFLKSYFLEGICVFLAVSPVIALVAYWKKSYWLALVLAEIYSFADLFTSMSNTLRTFYPVSAALGIAGYYETTGLARIQSSLVLLACGGISVLILRKLKHGRDE